MTHYVFLDVSGSSYMHGAYAKRLAHAQNLGGTLFAFSHRVAPYEDVNRVAGGGTDLNAIERFLQGGDDAHIGYPDKVSVIVDSDCYLPADKVQFPERWDIVEVN